MLRNVSSFLYNSVNGYPKVLSGCVQYVKYFTSFQFIEKLGSGKYKLDSKNGRSEEYDFLIWAGHPFDLPKLMYPCDMKNYLFDLFKTQESNYVTASFLSMKNSIRGKEFYRWRLF